MYTISNAMQEQSAGTEEILSSISSLIKATEEIKQMTREQSRQSDDMNQIMESLVTSGDEIKGIIESQTQSYKKLLDNLDQIKTISTKNTEVVMHLEKILGQFNV